MTVYLTHCYPVLPVADLIRTQEYYRDVFQFNVDWRDGKDFGQVSNGDIALFFQRADSPVPSFTIVLNTQDADAIYEVLKDAGADIVDPIATRSWGLREFRVRDINGHILRISHVDESIVDYSTFEINDGDTENMEDSG